VNWPTADAADLQEQQTAVLEEPPSPDEDLPDEASDADVAEQRAEVTLDEEDAPIG
jgi:hypothetical protein